MCDSLYRANSFVSSYAVAVIDGEPHQAPTSQNSFPCSNQLSTKFILLINVKMPKIVGILTFISMINTTSERLEARNFFICRYFSLYEQLKFRAHLSIRKVL